MGDTVKQKSNIIKFPIRFKVGQYVKSKKVPESLGLVVWNYRDDRYNVHFKLANGGEVTALHKGDQLESV